MSSILEVSNLKKVYPLQKHWWGKILQPEFTAVDSISFSVKKGEILGMLGPNGAGKSTTIFMLLDLLTPTAGEIYYFGSSFKKNRSTLLENIGYATTYAKLPSQLTVYDNLSFFGQLYGINYADRSQQIKDLLDSFHLTSIAHQSTGSLSAGQMTCVMLMKAFLAQPKMVLLDEPTASLDPEIAHLIRKFILEKRDKGTTFLFTSHNMHEVTEVCDRVIIMDRGKIIANNTPSQLAESVAKVTVELFITSPLEKLIHFAQEQNISFSIEGAFIQISTEEHKIASLLSDLGHHNITYSQISINKPSLEDYFLSLKTRAL